MSGYFSSTRVDLGTQAQLSSKELQDEIDIIYKAVRALHLALSQFEGSPNIDLDLVNGRSLLDFYQLNSGSRLILEAGSTIAAGDLVGLRDLSGKIERMHARAPSVYSSAFVGWAITGGEAGAPIIVYIAPAILPFFSGLLPGRTYFTTTTGLGFTNGLIGEYPAGLALNSTTLKLYSYSVELVEW